MAEQREFQSYLYTECEDPDCPSAYAYEDGRHFHYTGPAEPPEGVVEVRLQRRTPQGQIDYLIEKVSTLIGQMTTAIEQIEDLNARLRAVERATPLARPPKSPAPKLPPRSRER